MTKRISLRKCRRCVHHNPVCGCDYDYLENCHYVPRKDERVKDIYLAAVVFVGLLLSVLAFFYACTPQTQPEAPVPKWSAVELLRNQHREELTDWQMLEMAIIYTESKFFPDAVGAAGDAGLFQMLPIYVAEVNRVAGTDYAHADAYDPATAVEIFNTMQDNHNQAHDTDRAIALHNRGAAYRARVLENLELIRRYEAARTIIITH